MAAFKINSPWIFFLSLICLALTVGCVRESTEYQQRPVIKIANNELSVRALAQALAERLENLDALRAKDEKLISKLKESIIRDFIISSIMKQWSQKNGIQVLDTELESRIQKIRAQYPSDEAFKEALANSGKDFQKWKAELEVSLLQEKVFAELMDLIEKPSEKELKDYYQQNSKEFTQKAAVRLRHVLVDSEDKANKLRSSVRSGEKLEDIASKYSMAPEADRGGETDWIEEGTLDVFDKAFKMRKGRLSNVEKSPYGFHFFRVLDKRRSRRLKFAEVKENISRILMEKREQAVFYSWLERQVRQTRVLRDDKLLAAIRVETRK